MYYVVGVIAYIVAVTFIIVIIHGGTKDEI